jgi:hypothetical protein
LENKIEFSILVGIANGIVAGTIHGSVSTYQEGTSEGVVGVAIGVDRYVKVALNLLVLSEFDLSPLMIVEKLCDFFLQGIKHIAFRVRNLSTVDYNLCIQLLSGNRDWGYIREKPNQGN